MCTVWMDVYESKKGLEKQSTAETTRPPLVPADNKNGTTRRSRTREVSSRYKSPTPSGASGPKRCPSPNARRTSSISTATVPKRAVSAERRRPSAPSPPPSPSPSTPVRDTTAEMLLASRKTVSNKLPESLWPSTMRSLSVSFQSDTISAPIDKKERTVSHAPSDRTLKQSSNVAGKGETPLSRKPTPERKRSPLKGKNSADQLQNSKPVDSSHTHLLDQHRWPGRTSGKRSTALDSGDVTDKMHKTSSLSHSRMGTPSCRRLSLDGTSKTSSLSDSRTGTPSCRRLSLDGTSKTSSLSNSRLGTPSGRRLSLDGTSKPSQKSASDLLMLISRDDNGKEILYGSSVDDGSLRKRRPGSSSGSSNRLSLVNAAARAQCLPTSASRPASPSVSRGISPSRSKAVHPSSRGTSPVRVRPSSPSRQPQHSTSVLSFIADIKKGKKAANNIEDVHQLRLLYNRHLQWRYANARSDAAFRSQKVKAQKMLYIVSRIIVDLCDSVKEKRSDLQQLRFKLKLHSALDNQLTCLDEWASIERDHTNSLMWAIQDLQASTVRIPVTGGARVDIKTLGAAVHSAVDVMQAIGSSLCSTLPQVEETNLLMGELADIAAQERAMLDECESLLGSTGALQVEEYSRRTHLLQMKQAWRSGEPSVFGY